MLPKDLLSLEDLHKEDMEEILARARFFKEREGKGDHSSLKGKNIVISFWEPSTRTRVSFELAARKLGARVIDYVPDAGSEAKDESIEDTIKTLTALGADALVFRYKLPGLLGKISTRVEMPLISGGEGCYQHPTQALLDLFTLQEERLSLRGLKIVMVGDILHSRVARSHFYALPAFGAELILVAPPVLLPLELVPPGAEYTFNLETALSRGDVIYLLRVQQERQGKGLLPSLSEYASLFGLNEKRLSLLKKEAVIMHPGPVNQGIEVSPGAISYLEAYQPDKLLLQKQVQNGVYIRMAVLDLLLGGRG